MEGNKDDALKCMKIAKDALNSGDLQRARKFVSKAQRLDPSLLVDDLFSSLENDDTPVSSSSIPAENIAKAAEGESRRRKPNEAPASSAKSSFTEEQIAIVRRINKQKEYYEILGLEKSCSVEDVRKAYRKLSLKVHPDKNQAPGAEDAFKAVSKAFQCLSNEESRKKYDVTGSDDIVYERRSTARRYHAGGGGFNGYYDEFDPDEIFRQFFFGGMQPGGTTQFRSFNFGRSTRGNGGVQHEGSGLNFRALIQLLPVLIILLFQFMPSSEPIYSLSRNYPYEYKFTTMRAVDYYVKSSTRFNEDYPPNSSERLALEEKVERDYTQALAQNCRFEIQRRQWGFVRETPHCVMLHQFESRSSYSTESA